MEPWWPSRSTVPLSWYTSIAFQIIGSGLSCRPVLVPGVLLVVASQSSPLPPNPLLPLGERVALSGPLTQDMWLWLLR